MSFGVTRVLIRGLIPSLIKEGLSANKAQALLKSQGLKLRRKTFLDDWREFKGIKKKSKAWKFVPRKFKIPIEAFVMTGKNIGASRQYIFEADIRGETNRDTPPRKYSFTSNSELTRKKAEETMFDILNQASAVNEEYDSVIVDTVRFDLGLIREDALL